MRIAVLFSLFLLISSQAIAQQVASIKSTDARGNTYELCTAESTTGPCDNGSGDVFAQVDRFRQFSFWYSQSAGTSTCDIYALPGGVTPTADMTSLRTWKVNSTPLSSTDPVQFFELTMKYVFISCTISGGNVTVKMMASSPDTPRGQ